MGSVLDILAQEHVVFRRLIARLREAGLDEKGRQRVVRALLVLLPALKKHDELEHLLFDPQRANSPHSHELAHRLVEAQHVSIRGALAECEAVLAAERDVSLTRLLRMAELLAEKLSWHFQTEEMLLWPLYKAAESRSLEASLVHRAEHQLRQLKYSIAKIEEGVQEKA